MLAIGKETVTQCFAGFGMWEKSSEKSHISRTKPLSFLTILLPIMNNLKKFGKKVFK